MKQQQLEKTKQMQTWSKHQINLEKKVCLHRFEKGQADQNSNSGSGSLLSQEAEATLLELRCFV